MSDSTVTDAATDAGRGGDVGAVVVAAGGGGDATARPGRLNGVVGRDCGFDVRVRLFSTAGNELILPSLPRPWFRVLVPPLVVAVACRGFEGIKPGGGPLD